VSKQSQKFLRILFSSWCFVLSEGPFAIHNSIIAYRFSAIEKAVAGLKSLQ